MDQGPVVDTQPPVIPGDIQFFAVRHTTVRLMWPRAVDNHTEAADLEYRLVWAQDPAAIDTLAKAAALVGSGVVFDWTKDVWVYTVAGLADSTRYSFAVLVRDGAGNMALYPPRSVLTADRSPPVPGAPLAFSDIAADAATVSWGEAWDGVSPPAELQYKVVWSPVEAELSSVAAAEALPPRQVAMDWTPAVLRARVTGIPDVARTFVSVLVRDALGYKAMYPPALPMDLARGRLADWPLDGHVEDVSGANRHGMAVAVTPVADRLGQAGKALGFDRMSRVQLGSADVSGLGTAGTFSLWLKQDVLQADGDYQDLLVKARIFSLSSYNAGGALVVRFNTGGGTVWGMPVQSSGALALGRWNHIVVTFHNGVVTFYLNGEAAGTGSATHATLAASNMCPLTIGYKLETNNPACTVLHMENHLVGALDDIRLYNRVLSPVEIAVLYHERGY